VPEQSKSFDIYMQRLDVICEVTKFALQPGQRASKHDLRVLYNAAQKVVDAYTHEAIMQRKKDA
jgi:hypothetical protein